MAVDTGVVDTGEVVDLVAIGDGVMVMVVDFTIPGDGVGDMVTVTGVAITLIIRTILIIHIMEIPPMVKDMPLIQEDMEMEMATTEHLPQEIIGTALLRWEDLHRVLTIG